MDLRSGARPHPLETLSLLMASPPAAAANSQPWDVIVIGAGIAGLASARALAEAGLRTLVLEARDRIGGRILTLHRGSEVIELGAEFIHGRSPTLWSLIDETGLATYERTGDFLQNNHGDLSSIQQDDDDVLEKLKDFPGPDISFADYIARQPLSEESRQQETRFVEGFNAADAHEASVLALGTQQRAEDEIAGDRSWRVRDGYDALPDFLHQRFLAAGGTLLLGTEVEAVWWQPLAQDPSGSRVLAAGGQVFHAARVVVTLPLSLLQARSVNFQPEPAAILHAASLMRMGNVLRVTLLFRRRFWPQELSFLISTRSLPNVWWSAHPAESLTLTGWVGGPRSLALRSLHPAELQATVLQALAEALSLELAAVESEFLSLQTHDWGADPYSRGAYSWVPVGGSNASAQMCEPVAGTLFFAGEHTDTTGHWGTVHAALGSGLRAAHQVLAS